MEVPTTHPKLSSYRPSACLRFIAFAGLVAGLAACNLLFGGPDANESFVSMMSAGFILSQPLLLAAWLAFGPPPQITRMPLTIASLMFVSLSLMLVDPEDVPSDFFIVLLAFFAAAAGVMSAIRMLWKLRIADLGSAERGNHLAANQFSIKYLLILTTICAVLLGLGRAIVPVGDELSVNLSAFNWVSQLLIPLGLITLALFPTIVLPLIILSRAPMQPLLVFPIVWIILTLLSVEVIRQTEPNDDRWTILQQVIAIQTGAALAGGTCAIVIRLIGYRLTKGQSKTAAHHLQ